MGNDRTIKDKIIDKILKDSIWAVLFICLLYYVMNDAKVREEKYQQTIKCLSESVYTEVKDANKKLDEIRVVVKR